MNRSLIICDRLVYVALLGVIFFLPYSLALIEIFQVTMMVAWGAKCFLQSKTPAHQRPFSEGFNFASPSMWWSLAAIALLIVLTIPFSHYPALSLKKFFTRFLQQIFLMYMVTQVVRNRQRLYGVLGMLFFTLSLVMVDVITQYVSGRSIVHHTPITFGRITGPMNHPNDLGTLLVSVLPVVFISIVAFRKQMSWVGVIAISVLFFLLVNTLGLTASRGAWVSFVVSMVALSLYLKGPKLTVLIVLLLSVFLWVYGMRCLNTRIDMYSVGMTQGPVLKPSFTNPFGLPPGYSALELFSGTSGRELYWDTAGVVIKHYPWFGCGYSAYVQTLKDLQVGHTEYPHNSLLHITAELGFLGLAFYGWLFIALCIQIKNVLRRVSHERDLYLVGCGISAGLLAWVIHSLLDTAWASLQLSVLCWLLIGILLSLALVLPHQGEKPCLY